jgi:hypothetical protein
MTANSTDLQFMTVSKQVASTPEPISSHKQLVRSKSGSLTGASPEFYDASRLAPWGGGRCRQNDEKDGGS